MMFESDGNMETYTELTAVALDLHLAGDPREKGHETAAI